ncbi:hypothetical protein FB451DRAFT_1185297 [Mycena latifolia]|nr:hypothetical protein FB451DRAFT_1185297 [Mycena latifolia]
MDSLTSLIGILKKSRRLEGLHFHECTAAETGASKLPASRTSARKQIKHLSLAYSGLIAKWLIRPEFPLDFANLFYADITGSANPTVASLLEPVRETLKSLTFLAGEEE